MRDLAPPFQMEFTPTAIQQAMYEMRTATQDTQVFYVIYAPRWRLLEADIFAHHAGAGWAALFYLPDDAMGPYEWEIVVYDITTREALARLHYNNE